MSDGGVGGGNEITFELCGCGEGEKGGRVNAKWAKRKTVKKDTKWMAVGEGAGAPSPNRKQWKIVAIYATNRKRWKLQKEEEEEGHAEDEKFMRSSKQNKADN